MSLEEFPERRQDGPCVPLEGEEVCPEECWYCTGESCMRHGHESCDCDVIERHVKEDFGATMNESTPQPQSAVVIGMRIKDSAGQDWYAAEIDADLDAFEEATKAEAAVEIAELKQFLDDDPFIPEGDGNLVNRVKYALRYVGGLRVDYDRMVLACGEKDREIERLRAAAPSTGELAAVRFQSTPTAAEIEAHINDGGYWLRVWKDASANDGPKCLTVQVKQKRYGRYVFFNQNQSTWDYLDEDGPNYQWLPLQPNGVPVGVEATLTVEVATLSDTELLASFEAANKHHTQAARTLLKFYTEMTRRNEAATPAVKETQNDDTQI